ncbi:ribosomal protein S5 domain 2-like protein [Rozella allomycis CSF55]|uniref:Ribosomal RNA-processing protein 42 n=1 Tax=Rozella allomycis (strain CSF55) TaxID=988480 RepID=A0A075AYJ7_ROZAC|nr:Ribosomal protein S5 2-type fold domain-containing protein [Rozella allomycis CSF55]RKP19507.1 ribosomal protein S5 domain 2-like protein [Rozella allomycis CSF55]|eukprot:EPZ35400.1 Ribosomal protein S5 2-type fold domain-containing protein [Rozella allomycis CSF55]
MGISQTEKDFIKKGVLSDIRTDGRTRKKAREFNVDINPLPQASGSARVMMDMTDIVVGVKIDLSSPKIDSPNQGYVSVSVDCASSAFETLDPSYDPQNISTDLSRYLTNILMTKECINLKKLCIIPRQQCWVLYVDVLLLSYGGNIHDSALLALRYSLENAKIPSVKFGDDGMAFEISNDIDSYESIEIDGVPLSFTFAQIGDGIVIDPSVAEELAAQTCLSIAINRRNQVVYMQSRGRGSIKHNILLDIMKAAQNNAIETFNNYKNTLAESKNRKSVGFLAVGV